MSKKIRKQSTSIKHPTRYRIHLPLQHKLGMCVVSLRLVLVENIQKVNTVLGKYCSNLHHMLTEHQQKHIRLLQSNLFPFPVNL